MKIKININYFISTMNDSKAIQLFHRSWLQTLSIKSNNIIVTEA